MIYFTINKPNISFLTYFLDIFDSFRGKWGKLEFCTFDLEFKKIADVGLMWTFEFLFVMA